MTKSVSQLTKEQADLEKPVKGYQFKELTEALEEVQKGMKGMNRKLDSLIDGQKGIVTHAELSGILETLSEDIKKDVDLEYGATKSTVKTWSARLWAVTLVAIAALIGNLIALLKAFKV